VKFYSLGLFQAFFQLDQGTQDLSLTQVRVTVLVKIVLKELISIF